MKSIIIIGAGGHAKVIMDIILKNGNKLLGFLDDNKQTGDLILGYPVLGKIDICERYQEMNEELEYIVAIGNNILREEISEK